MNHYEKILDVILDNTSISYICVDRYGKITELHQSAADMLGLSSVAVRDMQFIELFPEFCSEIEHPQVISFRKDEKTTVSVSLSVVPAENSGRLVIIQDVTELTGVRKELSTANSFFSTLKNATPDLIILKDPRGEWLDWNEKANDHLEKLEISGNRVPRLSPICSESDASAWNLGKYVRMDEKLPAGQVYDVVKIPVRNDDGTPRYMLVMARDITDRSLREEKIKRLSITMNMLRSVDKLIIEAEDVHRLSEQTVKVLTDSGVFSGCAIVLKTKDGDSRFGTDQHLMSFKSAIVSPMEYRGVIYGYLVVSLLKSEFLDDVSELTEILAEMARDIGYAIHGIKVTAEQKQVKNMLDSFLENIPGIAFIRDSSSKYMRMNKFMLEYLREPGGTGKNLHESPSPAVLENIEKIDMEVLEKEHIYRKKTFHDKNGEEHVFSGHYFRIEMPDGEPLIGGIGLEITDRLEAEESLRKSEERYRTIYESTVTAMAILGSDGGVVSANSNVVDLTGFDLEEIVNKMTWVNFVHPEDLQSVAEQRKKRLAGDPSVHQEYEFRLIRKNGEIRNIRMRTGTIPNSNGMGVISLSDITNLIDYQKQLNKFLTRTEAILEAIPDLMFVLSRDGKFLNFHHGDRNVFHFDSVEMTGKSISDTKLPGLTADEILEKIEFTLETREVATTEYELDLPDGHHFYEAGIAPFESDSVLMLCRDVTIRKEAEAERERLQAQVRHVQKLESLGVLAGGIAHDFNNILMVISGNAQLALKTGKDHEAAAKYIGAISTATRRAADLAGQMLAYAGRGELTIVPLDLNSVVDDIADMLRITVSKKALVKYNPGENLPMIMADPIQVQQIFMNLITNASEALEDSNGTIDISTGVLYCDDEYVDSFERLDDLSAGDYAYVEVTDSGVGMSDEVKKNIFNPFFSTKFAGRGLGLSTVLGIMSTHKGAIEIESALGEGSKFRVLFPIIMDNSFVSPNASQISRDSWHTEGTVLFVDDEIQVRSVVEAMLDALGMTVISAVDGCDCIDKFSSNPSGIDLVILDITMPNMDGDEVFRKIRKLRKDIPVLISSGYSENEVISRFTNDYPDGFLQKPYSADELQSKIKNVFKQ